MNNDRQTVLHSGPRGRIVAMDTAYHVDESNRDRDVVVNSSYCGVLPARFLAEHRPRAVMSIDCGVGPQGAAIAGLWYLEALNIPAVTVDVMTVHLGAGVEIYDRGVVSFCNRPALDCGVVKGMRGREAAHKLLESDPKSPGAGEVTNRSLVEAGPDNRQVVCVDSIAFGTPEDARNVLVTAGVTGRSSLPYIRRVQPFGFICSDGGMGLDQSGIAALAIVEQEGLAGASVDARTARMGDGLSTYHDGIIVAANALALAAGVAIGMPASKAASLLVWREHKGSGVP